MRIIDLFDLKISYVTLQVTTLLLAYESEPCLGSFRVHPMMTGTSNSLMDLDGLHILLGQVLFIGFESSSSTDVLCSCINHIGYNS